MRADVWRLLVIQRYGGVYLDGDMSAVAPLPVRPDDTAVSGVGGWSHLPGKNGGTKPGGVLEHWAVAFMPRHPYVDAAVDDVSAQHVGVVRVGIFPERWLRLVKVLIDSVQATGYSGW